MISKGDSDKTSWIIENYFVPVNTGEFVDKGTLNNGQIYIDGDFLTFTLLDSKSIKYYSLNLTDKSSNRGIFDIATQSISKDIHSFVYQQHIYRVDTQKQDLKLTVFDITSAEQKKELNSNSDLSHVFTDTALKNTYFKILWKKSYKPTITVNTSVEGNPVVRLSYANIATHNYYHDWWFHHFMFQHQMQMQMMQQSIPNIPGFQPNPEFYEKLGTVYTLEAVEIYYDILLDANFEAVKDGNLETKFRSINKDKYLKPFKSNTFLKNLSAAFTKTQMRYMYFDKSAKTVVVNYHNLKKKQ